MQKFQQRRLPISDLGRVEALIDDTYRGNRDQFHSFFELKRMELEEDLQLLRNQLTWWLEEELTDDQRQKIDELTVKLAGLESFKKTLADFIDQSEFFSKKQR